MEKQGKVKEKEDEMPQFCSFVGECSHRGPQDDGEAELSKRYSNDRKLAVVVHDISNYFSNMS